MPCPSCDSSNIDVYDRDRYECQDCGYLVNKSDYHYKNKVKKKSHTQRTGLCKIINSRKTGQVFGTNGGMIEMVCDDKIRRYKTKMIKDNNGEQRIAYVVGSWVWDIQDLILVDQEGNEIEEYPLPEPTQFNVNTLYL